MTLRRWTFDDDLERLVDARRRGELLVIPTESSYGLGVDPASEQAVENLYRLKGRPAERALPVVVADLEQARQLGVIVDDPAVRKARQYWPGALTLIAPLDEPLAASGRRLDLAFRIPGFEPLLTLLRRLGPLTATSANRSGEPPITEPAAVAEWLEVEASESVAWLVDAGKLAGGEPSTVVSWSGGAWTVHRSGRVQVISSPDS